MSHTATIYAIEAVTFDCAACGAYLENAAGTLWTYEEWRHVYQNGAGIGGARCPSCGQFNRLPAWPQLPATPPAPRTALGQVVQDGSGLRWRIVGHAYQADAAGWLAQLEPTQGTPPGSRLWIAEPDLLPAP